MRTIVITGAGSGLGLAFLEQYSKDASNTIFAIDRTWPESLLTSFHSPLINHYTINVISESDLESFVQILNSKIASGTAQKHPLIDLIIHSAGIRGLVPDVPIKQSSDVARAETLDVMDTATLIKTFEVNVTGTFLLMKHLLPFLRPSAPNPVPGSSPMTVSKVVIMGSRMGSISSNTGGGGYAYRASKAALNAIVKSFSIDVPDVCFVVVHPGRVATKLCDGVREENAMEAAEVLPALVQLIDGWDLKDSGRFVDRVGKDIGW